jgi:hypothetical protein
LGGVAHAMCGVYLAFFPLVFLALLYDVEKNCCTPTILCVMYVICEFLLLCYARVDGSLMLGGLDVG